MSHKTLTEVFGASENVMATEMTKLNTRIEEMYQRRAKRIDRLMNLSLAGFIIAVIGQPLFLMFLFSPADKREGRTPTPPS